MKKAKFRYDIAECIPIEELIQYREGKLDVERRKHVRAHLAYCPSCSYFLVKARDTGQEPSLLMSEALMDEINRIAREAWTQTRKEQESGTPGGIFDSLFRSPIRLQLAPVYLDAHGEEERKHLPEQRNACPELERFDCEPYYLVYAEEIAGTPQVRVYIKVHPKKRYPNLRVQLLSGDHVLAEDTYGKGKTTVRLEIDKNELSESLLLGFVPIEPREGGPGAE
jgi:hypothetical protein